MRLLRRSSVNALRARRRSRAIDRQIAASHARAAALDRLTQYRVIHGYRRAFVHVGSGPALLLIHGIGNSLEGWAAQIEDLSRDYTVVAPDLLGHGRSDKPRADYSVAAYANGMRDLISVLGVDRVTVVGHSLGGGVATQFAYQFPERCERLVLVSAGGVSRAVHPMLRALTAPLAEQAMACLQLPGARPVAKVLFEALRLAGNDLSRDTADVMLMFDALRDGFSRKAFRRTLSAVVDLQGQVVTMLDRCYLTAGMPTLLVWGKRDAVIPYEHGLLAHAAMPGSQLVTFDEAGHFPHHTDPERFNRVLREFLSATEPASYSSEQWRDILRSGGPIGVRRDLPRSWQPAQSQQGQANPSEPPREPLRMVTSR